jgi:hypothetical protein
MMPRGPTGRAERVIVDRSRFALAHETLRKRIKLGTRNSAVTITIDAPVGNDQRNET